ncbi:MAG: Na+/H+ antiporter subunit E [Desulfobacterales bacterium]|nr:Na+/H+ antiporter subunit E [Desulfobacterales bacterium]
MAIKKQTVRNSTHAWRFSFNTAFLFTFFIMLGIWFILSGRFDVFHITLGVLSSLIVSTVSRDLIFPGLTLRTLWRMIRLWLRFAAYIPWLICQIFLANLHVLQLCFHPKKIDPRMVEFKSKLKNEVALVTLANSITLTPGTITVSVSAIGEFTVHAIDGELAKGLPGDMETRVARVFGEK